MQEREKIAVYIRIENGKTICICKRDKKKCGRNCDTDVVERDKFNGWEQILRRNQYGR